MIGRVLSGAAATALALGLAGPAVAHPPRPDPLAGVPSHPDWGSVAGVSGVLKQGCHTYHYTYTVTPPEGIWALEVFITAPGYKHVAAGGFLDGYDSTSGTGDYTLCKPTVRYGTYQIEAKVSVDDGSGNIQEGRTDTTTYTLTKPPKRHHHHHHGHHHHG